MESALEYPCVYHAHPILGRRLHLAGDTAAEKDFDMAIKMALEHLVQRSKKIEMDEKN